MKDIKTNSLTTAIESESLDKDTIRGIKTKEIVGFFKRNAATYEECICYLATKNVRVRTGTVCSIMDARINDRRKVETRECKITGQMAGVYTLNQELYLTLINQ